MFIPSSVPLSECFRNACDGRFRQAAAIDVGLNELQDGVAGHSGVSVTATIVCMEEITNT